MAGISILEIEKKQENVTPDGIRRNNKEAEETADGSYLLPLLLLNVYMYIHMTLAQKSILEKNCANVTPDEIDTADRCSILLPEESQWDKEEIPKDSPGLKEEEIPKDSPGLKEKSEEIAASEQNTSKGKDRSLPCSNKKRKRKTCSNKFAVIEPKYVYMLIGYVILIGTLVSGANGKVDVQREYFRSITIATSETKVATFPVPTPVDGSNFLIFARDGNNPISYTCSPEFMAVNKTCSLEMGDKTTECEGLQISENGNRTHLAVEGSKLTHDHTAFCIIQQFPGLQALYTLEVFKIDNENPVISGCPSDQSVNTGSGNAKALVTWTPPTATDNSGTQTLTSTDNPGDYFPIGNNTVTYTSTDTAGNTDTCTFCVAVTDNENPVISGCPSDQSVNTGSGNAKAVVTWTPPTATDNSGTQTLTSTDKPGDYFPIGNNTVTYTSTDAAGNTDICTFLIQYINECASNPCQNEGVCVDGLDSFTCNCAKGFNGVNCEIAPKTNHYKVAFFILVFILVIAIAIVIKKKFPCIRAWWKKIWMERVPTTDPDQGQNTTVLHDLDRTIDSVA